MFSFLFFEWRVCPIIIKIVFLYLSVLLLAESHNLKKNNKQLIFFLVQNVKREILPNWPKINTI